MNDKKFETDLLDVGGMMRQGYSYFITNGGKIIAILTLAVAVMVMFTDVRFSTASSYELIITLVMMLIASYIMFFSLENAGERLGEEEEGYVAALERYKAVRAKISATDIIPLRAFCNDYSREELEYRRLSLLTEYGYTVEEYRDYLGGAEVSKRAKRAFKKCDRLRSVTLSPKSLLSCERTTFSSELINPERYKFPYLILQLVPSSLCMAFTVSVILHTKDGLDASSVMDGIFKLTALPIIGLRGYSEGYSFVKNGKSAWLETKSRLLETFLSDKTA